MASLAALQMRCILLARPVHSVARGRVRKRGQTIASKRLPSATASLFVGSADPVIHAGRSEQRKRQASHHRLARLREPKRRIAVGWGCSCDCVSERDEVGGEAPSDACGNFADRQYNASRERKVLDACGNAARFSAQGPSPVSLT